MTPGEAADRVAIAHLQSTYADVITRRAWAELVPLFADGAPVTVDTRRGEPIQLTGAVAVGEFVAGAVARFAFFEVALLNTVVEVVAGDEATGRVYTLELREDRDGGAWSSALGVYQDAYRRSGERWAFARRRYSSLARVTAPPGTEVESFAFPAPPAPG